MNRSEFLRHSLTMGLGLPFLSSLLTACNDQSFFGTDFKPTFEGKVLIIGAGAAGITAGYILQKHHIDFQILEANSDFGGRVKRLDGFADFPIDLGGEWIHTDPAILSDLIADSSVDANIDIVNYRPKTISVWRNNKLRKMNFASHFYREYKFKSTTWYGFFEQFMVPSIAEKMEFEQVVTNIDYSGDKVQVSTNTGEIYQADRVLVTVPIKILQEDMIKFEPAWPSEKREALASIDMPAGLKVFLSFSERFYPDILMENLTAGTEKTFYDAAFGKDTNHAVLGLFTVGTPAKRYTDLGSDERIIEEVLQELDTIFEGKASRYLQEAVVQNWSAEPYIQGSYSHYGGNFNSTMQILLEPLENKVYFAGEALNEGGDTSTVHGAAESAYRVLERMLAV